MTRDDIIRMAKKAELQCYMNLTEHSLAIEDLEHFAALVRDDYSYKPWFGLTAEDYDSMRPRVPDIVNDFSFADVAAIVEAKLKEKNHG